jgi:hypothetical protein
LTAFRALKYGSFAHSAIYCCLLFASLTDRETLGLGWAHGVGWIVMALACLVAAQRRIVPLKVAVAVVVLGGVGPFFGSGAFVLEERRRKGLHRVAVRE